MILAQLRINGTHIGFNIACFIQSLMHVSLTLL